MTDSQPQRPSGDTAKEAGTTGHAMVTALRLAEATGRLGNVPVGAVVLDRDGRTVGVGANQRHVLRDPTAHAELIAIREAARQLDRWRLDGATLVVTLEPCAMCASAIAQARIQRVVYGAAEVNGRAPSGGQPGRSKETARRILAEAGVEVVGGLEESDCMRVLGDFFGRLRRGDTPSGEMAELVEGA